MLTATGPRRMDLLFVVDDSASMADKSAVLELAVVDLTQALPNPPCRTDSGELLPPPADPSDGTRRFVRGEETESQTLLLRLLL
jgi:hypothetical protein